MGFKKIQIILCSILLNVLLLVSANAQSENECFEKVSRGIFKFNQGFDNIILEPVAKVYNKLPEPIKNGTGNFASNIATLLSIPNHLLQGELRSAGHATGSFLVNSTIGVLGLGNPAAKMGLKPKRRSRSNFRRLRSQGWMLFCFTNFRSNDIKRLYWNGY